MIVHQIKNKFCQKNSRKQMIFDQKTTCNNLNIFYILQTQMFKMCYFGPVGRARAWYARGHELKSQRVWTFWPHTYVNIIHIWNAALTHKHSLRPFNNVEKKHQGLDLIIPSTNVEWLKKIQGLGRLLIFNDAYNNLGSNLVVRPAKDLGKNFFKTRD